MAVSGGMEGCQGEGEGRMGRGKRFLRCVTPVDVTTGRARDGGKGDI
jgi:hypothetical protein